MRVVLGVTGGIAAYKSAEIVRLLTARGASVQVAMTANACEFIQPLTFAALTGRPVLTSTFGSNGEIDHIAIAREADLLLVAPATASILAKFAHGLADDFLSTLYLAYEGPVVLAPAMNTNMWQHPATRANVATLAARGHTIVEPGEGQLACGTTGPGRLAEPAAIVEAALRVAAPQRDLDGQTVLITAGPTREPIDPVRYLTNRSSGRMGYALAEAAHARGAQVVLVSGPVQLEKPAGVTLAAVETAHDMYQAVMAHLAAATIVIMSAAVADYRPASVPSQKIKKAQAALSVTLEPTQDILASVGREKGERIVVGFAAETENLLAEARRKLEAKHCDMIVANLVSEAGIGFDSKENEVTLVLPRGETVAVARAPKRQIADRILDQIVKLGR